jgi:hypothetical protein
MFSHFDVKGDRRVSKKEFTAGLSRSAQDQEFEPSIGNSIINSVEDIIKPLSTRIKRLKMTANQLFEQSDSSRDARLSAEELK